MSSVKFERLKQLATGQTQPAQSHAPPNEELQKINGRLDQLTIQVTKLERLFGGMEYQTADTIEKKIREATETIRAEIEQLASSISRQKAG